MDYPIKPLNKMVKIPFVSQYVPMGHVVIVGGVVVCVVAFALYYGKSKAPATA